MAEETQSITTRHDAETDPALWVAAGRGLPGVSTFLQGSRGEGLGQIAGVTEKMDYLKNLASTRFG